MLKCQNLDTLQMSFSNIGTVQSKVAKMFSTTSYLLNGHGAWRALPLLQTHSGKLGIDVVLWITNQV